MSYRSNTLRVRWPEIFVGDLQHPRQHHQFAVDGPVCGACGLAHGDRIVSLPPPDAGEPIPGKERIVLAGHERAWTSGDRIRAH